MKYFETEDGRKAVSRDREIINKKELAEWLGISIPTIQRWQRQGLPHTRFKNFIAYDKGEVEEWLMQNNYGPPNLIAKWNKQSKDRKRKGGAEQ